MSVASFSPSVSTSSASATSSFPALPTGCAGLSGTHASGSFQGCVVGSPTVLQTCCSAVGSTPVFANDTCGCPFTSVFLSNETESFFDCLDKNNEEGGCLDVSSPSLSISIRPRWKLNFALVALGAFSLVFVEVGA
ncbi:hypothetical protein MSAN_01210900 [Mycena sanguinolenta]|uniref:Uncharacterized protein n=1 Tax=Mycena sanguinolenta TaxID=230812 RepID=A0A8H7D1M9_9AGAR|nr:hypothetical protein MSAN_01210900 [Mycena sanguinolenta]